MQKLLLTEQVKRMNANWRWNRNRPNNPDDFMPVVKIFLPWRAATWLLTELDPEDQDTAFGLCDLGMGEPELGYVSLSELRSVRGPGGLYAERDMRWKAHKPLSQYADEARAKGGVWA